MIKNIFKGFGILLIVLVLLTGLGQGLGWFSVFSTKTLGKAKQNAETEVFYKTQAFKDAKKQAAIKYYKEYIKSTPDEKKIICDLISQEFSNFDESELDYRLAKFISNCKY